MILKVVRGDYFPGLINYIMRRGQYASKDDTARVIHCYGVYNPLTAAAQLWMQAAKAPDRSKRAVHFIGRAEKMLTDEQYIRTAQDGLAVMGLGDRPYLLVVHDDGGFHCATVEVDEFGAPPPRRLYSKSLRRDVSKDEADTMVRGDVISRSWDSHVAWRLTDLARRLEIEFSLQRIGREDDSYDQIRIPDWQLRREARDGLAPLQEILGGEIKSALELTTWDERADALAVHGLGLRSYAGPNRKRKGLQIFALSDPRHFCNGSALGKRYGLGALEKTTDKAFDEWLASRQNLSPPEGRNPHDVEDHGRARGDDGELKREFDQVVANHREIRKKARTVATKRHAQIEKIRRTVDFFRKRLLSTGRVSRAWARILCAVLRAQMHANAHRVRGKERTGAKPERAPTWLQFLKSKAHDHPIADALHKSLMKKGRARRGQPLFDMPVRTATPSSTANVSGSSPSSNRSTFQKEEERVATSSHDAVDLPQDNLPSVAAPVDWSIENKSTGGMAAASGPKHRRSTSEGSADEPVQSESTVANTDFRRAAAKKLSAGSPTTTAVIKNLKAQVSERQARSQTLPPEQATDARASISERTQEKTPVPQPGDRFGQKDVPEFALFRETPACSEAVAYPGPEHTAFSGVRGEGKAAQEDSPLADNLFAQARSLKVAKSSDETKPSRLPSHGSKPPLDPAQLANRFHDGRNDRAGR